MSTSIPYCKIQCADAESIKPFTFSYFNSIAEVNALQWNRHIPEGNKLMQSEYLQLLEETQHGKLEFKYVLVKKDDVTVGACYFQIVPFRANDLLNYFPSVEPVGYKKYIFRIAKQITKQLLSTINVKLLVSGNTFMTGENGFYFNHQISAHEKAVMLRKISREIIQQNEMVKAVLISDLYEPKTDFDKDFLKRGYSEITVEQDMAIRLKPEWQTFDDYLNALSSKYRVRAKKVFSMCHDAGVEKRDLTASEIKQYQQQIFALYNLVMTKADFKLSMLTDDYFARQKEQLPNNYHVYGYFKSGEMIGFISVFNFGKRAEVHYVGMNHELTKPVHLYQHMMYDMVAFAIENRMEKLHFGRTAPEIKSTIGAVGSSMYGYLKHQSFLFNIFLMRPFTKRLKPKIYTLREPFKVNG